MIKMYVVIKLIEATSVEEACRTEHDYPVAEVMLDQEWRKNNLPELVQDRVIGFSAL